MSDTESFEHAMEFARAVVSDCDAPILDRLQSAYEREIEHVRKAEYARGYNDGQRSMDAEHYAVVLRLRHLPLDEDSHGNLSQIARAVWHSDFGWTQGECKGLRDELVRLMGGVHEPDAALPTYDVLGNERHKAVCELRKFKPMIGSRPTEEASKLIRCITGKSDSHVACGNDLEETRDRLIHLLGGDEPFGSFTKSGDFGKLDSTNDGEISNERHKAIAEMRKIDADAGGFVKALAGAVGVEWHAPRVHQTIAEVRDRLIHLLGGDEPTLSEVTTELSQASVDAMSRRADQSHDFSPITPENETGITYELREKIHEKVNQELYVVVEADDLYAIADNIDEQFARCCELWERTATDTAQEIHDSMEAECNKLMEQQFELQQSLREVAECLKLPNAHELHGYKIDAVTKLVIGAINKLVDECDRLTEALDELQADPLSDVLVRVENERDELRRQMYQQRAMLTEQRDEARAKVLRLESENAEWRRGAERDADKLESLTGAYNDAVTENDELRKKLEGLEKFDPDIAMAAYGDDNNDELRRLLYRAAKLLANAEQDRDANYAYWMDCKEKVVQKSVTIDELSKELEDARDALNEATGRWAKADEDRRELQDRLDAIREAVNAMQ